MAIPRERATVEGLEIRRAGEFARTFRVFGSAGSYACRTYGVRFYQQAAKDAFAHYGVRPRRQVEVAVQLHREPNNPHGREAIAVVLAGKKVGHLPRDVAKSWAPLLDDVLAAGWSEIEAGATLHENPLADPDYRYKIDVWASSPLIPLTNVSASPPDQPLIFLRPWTSSPLERTMEQEERLVNLIRSNPALTPGNTIHLWGRVYAEGDRITCIIPAVGEVGHTDVRPDTATAIQEVTCHGWAMSTVSLRILKTRPPRLAVQLDQVSAVSSGG